MHLGCGTRFGVCDHIPEPLLIQLLQKRAALRFEPQDDGSVNISFPHTAAAEAACPAPATQSFIDCQWCFYAFL